MPKNLPIYLLFVKPYFNPTNFLQKNNIADLNLKINYQEFDKKSYRDKLIKFNNWMDNPDSDYFEDPCNEWSSN